MDPLTVLMTSDKIDGKSFPGSTVRSSENDASLDTSDSEVDILDSSEDDYIADILNKSAGETSEDEAEEFR